MAKIRQEINILAGESVADGLSGSAIVRLDTTQYNGTVTYYFEIIAVTNSSSDCVVRLTRLGTTTDDATITVGTSVTTKTRLRSSAFTPPSGATSYFIRLDSVTNTCTVNVARIIVIQEFTTLTNTETQIEIGNAETGLLNTTQTALTNPKYWLYTAANWDGTLSCFAEVTYTQASNMKNTTIVLQEDNGSFASWTNKVTIVNAGTAATPTLVRASFTPTDGRNYRITTASSSNMITHSVFNAKVVVDQNTTSTIVDQNTASPANPRVFSATLTEAGQSFTPSSSGNLLTVKFSLDKANSPTGNAVAKLYNHSGTYGTNGKPTGTALATSDNFDVSTLTTTASLITFNFSTTVALSSGTNYFITVEYTGADATNYIRLYTDNATSPHSGNTATKTSGVWSSNNVIDCIFEVAIGNLTKLEPQYLLANTGSFGASTGLKDYDTLYDPAEWDGVL
jgi:hypothetical protein